MLALMVMNIEKQFTKAIEKVGAIVENPDLYMYLLVMEKSKINSQIYININQKELKK